MKIEEWMMYINKHQELICRRCCLPILFITDKPFTIGELRLLVIQHAREIHNVEVD